VRAAPLKREPQCFESSLIIESTRSDQEGEVQEVLHAAVLRLPRERVCVDLFGELLLASDHANAGRRDSRETQPVPTLDRVMRLDDNVANACVEVKSGKDPRVHSSLDWVTGATV